MWHYVVVWHLITVAFGVPDPEDQYCALRYRRLCQGKGQHIGCQYPDYGPGPKCERYAFIHFTNELKFFITHYLNRRRQRIAAGHERVRGGLNLPKPQIMMLVEWDRELALLAQRLADQCNFVHDDCRATVKYPYAGQTVGEVRWRRSSESDALSDRRAMRRVLDAWWGEKRRVYADELTAPFRLTAKGTTWGHFSQLAVWNLRAVGCGAVRHGSRHPKLLLVCDFSHTNMLGQRTIVPGPMAPCPLHTVRRFRTAYPALCGPVRHFQQESEEIEEDNYDDDNYEDNDSPGNPGAANNEVGDIISSPNSQQRQTIEDIPYFIETTHDMDRIYSDYGELPMRKLDTTVYKTQPAPYSRTVTPAIPKEQHKMNPERDRQILFLNAGREVALPSNRYFNPAALSDWRVKKKYYGNTEQWHSDHEVDIKPAIPLTVPRRPFTTSHDDRMLDERRTTTRKIIDEAAENVSSFRGKYYHQELEFRHRWKQTSMRHRRPGANALLSSTSEKQPKKEAIASFQLDKEDADQLYRDTGFNTHWRDKKPHQTK